MMKKLKTLIFIISLSFVTFANAGDCVKKNDKSIRGALDCIEKKTDDLGYGKKGTAVNKTSSRNWAQCPKGYYVSGIKGVDLDGGGYCRSCISDIEIQCSPL